MGKIESKQPFCGSNAGLVRGFKTGKKLSGSEFTGLEANVQSIAVMSQESIAFSFEICEDSIASRSVMRRENMRL